MIVNGELITEVPPTTHFLLQDNVVGHGAFGGSSEHSDLYCPMWYSRETSTTQTNSKMAADSGMDTCPSPENPDSRKRPLDGDVENGVTKRSHYGGAGDSMYHFKILVPSVAAGAIIGKGGETIAQLQKDTSARVKMSKAHDFYPGTSERICLISGSVEAILEVLTFIMEKIHEKPDLIKQIPEFDVKGSGERDKQVKILVPNSTAGMIIGKAGNYIKQLKEESGSYVQISQKAKDLSLQERCITVIGERECNKNACLMILAKVIEDPQSGSCLNVSYADISGPVANYNPTGSPYAHSQGQATANSFSANPAPITVSQLMMNGGLSLGGGGSSAASLNLNLGSSNAHSTAAHSLTSQLLDNIKLSLRSSGYSDHATAEIAAAMTTLAKYGVLGMGLGLGGGSTSMLSAGNYLGVSPMDATPTVGQAANGAVFGPIGTSASSRSSLELCYDPFMPGQVSPPPPPPPHINNNSFGLGQQASMTDATDQLEAGGGKKVEMEIPEIIVGAILGPGGRALVEIQHFSGANIQISKKGIFAPGTRNRVVTIVGLPTAIARAKMLIEQRINEEEVKRTRHNSLALLQ